MGETSDAFGTEMCCAAGGMWGEAEGFSEMSDFSNEPGTSVRIRQLEQEIAELREAVENARLLTENELRIAARIHESLLPRPVRHPRIAIETRYSPASGLGGDYCQVLFPDESTCCISICDVTGHGIGPALLATRVSSEVRRLTFEGCAPADILQRVNHFMLQNFADTDLQLSFFEARIDLNKRLLTYSGGGHPAPLLIRGDTKQVEPLASQNMLLGVRENCLGEDPQGSVSLRSRDCLVFYTDGLTETWTVGGTLLGQRELIELARDICAGGVVELVDCILNRVAERRDGPIRDDMTLIAAEIQ